MVTSHCVMLLPISATLANHAGMPHAKVLVQMPDVLVMLTFLLLFRVLVIGIRLWGWAQRFGASVLSPLADASPWVSLADESYHQFLRNCGYSESLTLQFCCQNLWSFQCQYSHPHPRGLHLHSHPHLLHWSHCHPGRWTCCLCCTLHLIQLVVLAQQSGNWQDAELEQDLAMLVPRDGVLGSELAGE